MENAVEFSKKSLTTTRIGIWSIFFTVGIISMGWVPRIPEIKKSLGLNDGQFGILLVASSTGAAVGAQITGRMIHTFGSRVVLRVAATVMSVGLICIGVSHSPIVIAASLFSLGVGYAGADVSSNTQAVALERIIKKRIMIGFHGAWSIGAFVVALFGSFAIKHHISPERDFVTLGIVGLVAFHIAIFASLDKSHDDHPQEVNQEVSKGKIPFFSKKVIPLWWLGVGAIGALIPEGAVSDWGGILLHENFHLTKVVSTTAFGTFAVAMIISRLIGDHFLHKWGPEKIIRLGGLIAGLGMGIGILVSQFIYSSHPAVALVIVDIGFFCAGIGIGPMFPSFMLSAGAIEGVPPAVAISRVGVIAISSYFLGPTIIGLLAQIFTLPYAFMYPVAFLVFVGVVSRKMAPQSNSKK